MTAEDFVPVEEAIYLHRLDETADSLEAGTETVFSSLISAFDRPDDDTLRVFGNFVIMNFDADSDCPDDLVVKNGEGRMELLTLAKNEDGTYEVTDCVGEEEGEGFSDSIKKMCEEIGLDADTFYESLALNNLLYVCNLHDRKQCVIQSIQDLPNFRLWFQNPASFLQSHSMLRRANDFTVLIGAANKNVRKSLKRIYNMKPAFYEPSICMCTPENPNTMGVCVTLTEPVNGTALQEAIERLRVRFPYFYVRVKVEGNNLIVIPNDLPVVIRSTWDPILLCSSEANYHLLSFKYEGNRLAAEISHSITDGAGFLPYFKSVLYCYLSTVTGQKFDPTGFRLPGDEIPEAETGNPFANIDLDAAEEPLYQKPPVTDYFRLENPEEDGKRECTAFYLRFPEDQVIRYCKENDGSPNILFSVILARAARRYDPAGEKTVSCLVSVDNKAQLGNFENYRMFVDTSYVDMPKEQADYDILKACTKARGQLMLQAQPENVMYTLKTRKAGYEKMEQMPLQMCVDIVKQAIGAHRASFCVSYANSRSFGPLDPYIQEVYLLSEPYVTDVMVELSCINHRFFAMFGQPFTSEKFFRAFLAELDDAGIPYDIMRKEPFRLCGVRYDGLEGVSL